MSAHRAGLMAAVFVAMAVTVANAQCDPAPEPVLSLSYGSRYSDDSANRSEIDPEAADDADGALRPVDDFLRDLTELSNTVFDEDANRHAVADCVVDQIATWAAADALSDLGSDTANLTIGSRIAGFGLVMLQVLPLTSRTEDADRIKTWLAGLMQTQMRYWEEEAPNGARQGNLRAWAALGAASIAAIGDDPAIRAWATWSTNYVLCTAAPDGSLPQEMRRGNYALKYQLHAIAPLVLTTLLLDRQGVNLQGVCDQALDRVVGFAVADLGTGGVTRDITGKEQSFFDGTEELQGFHLAWIEAYLLLDGAANRDALDQLAEQYRPLNYSKLGGNQTAIWN